MSDNNNDILTLVSKEGEKFKVNKKIINMCGLLMDLFESNDDTTEDVPLSQIPSRFMSDIIQFCEHYDFRKEANIPTPLPHPSLS